MTWNVWWRWGGNWAQREPRIQAVIDAVQPDLLGMQETWATSETSQADDLATRLGGHSIFSRTSMPPEPDPVEYPEQAGARIGIALVSRWPISDVEVHRLPASRSEPPSALQVAVDHPAGNMHVIVSCTEWRPEFADDHLAQINALASVLSDKCLDGNLPVLLMADLNAPPGSRMLEPIDAVASDLWVLGGGDPYAASLPSSTPFAPLDAVGLIDERIDYVYARPGRPDAPLRVERAFLAGSSEVDGLYPSDHFAVVTDVALPESF